MKQVKNQWNYELVIWKYLKCQKLPTEGKLEGLQRKLDSLSNWSEEQWARMFMWLMENDERFSKSVKGIYFQNKTFFSRINIESQIDSVGFIMLSFCVKNKVTYQIKNLELTCPSFVSLLWKKFKQFKKHARNHHEQEMRMIQRYFNGKYTMVIEKEKDLKPSPRIIRKESIHEVRMMKGEEVIAEKRIIYSPELRPDSYRDFSLPVLENISTLFRQDIEGVELENDSSYLPTSFAEAELKQALVNTIMYLRGNENETIANQLESLRKEHDPVRFEKAYNSCFKNNLANVKKLAKFREVIRLYFSESERGQKSLEGYIAGLLRHKKWLEQEIVNHDIIPMNSKLMEVIQKIDHIINWSIDPEISRIVSKYSCLA